MEALLRALPSCAFTSPPNTRSFPFPYSSPSHVACTCAASRTTLHYLVSPLLRIPDSHSSLPSPKQLCRAAEDDFPDPIPEFAEAETEKFRTHLVNRLSKKPDIFGDSVDEVVTICTEIFSNFLHTEYGGPGTLLVVPFIDMADTVNERGLTGGPQAARAAVVWAQKHVDKDWNEWTGAEDDDE
ncbi:hypothetical protein H6P81_012561 [Aristolochia fimbriata]|uniref:Uncharacterized protein n=1 Tax=Aristolochia fimbriata TaxID=158543 RepID=A0AAV7EGT0_ARIFI|nr:hypothetical protein H6P81_012561 [Aristolochia fimbriata]